MIGAVPRNPNGKLFTWSFSAMNDFDTCPAQYAAKRYYETTTSEDTEATIWGTLVHKAMELRLRDKQPLSSEFAAYEKYALAIEKLGGEILCEQQVALTRELTPTDWFAPDVWCRGVFDVAVRDGETLYLFDYKTGKVKDNPLQMHIFAALASQVYSGVRKYRTRFLWLKHDHATGEDYTGYDVDKIWPKLIQKAGRMMEAWDEKVFNCNPSGLCRGWCPVTECIHYRERR